MISLLCPTRKRPANLIRLLDSIVRTAATIPEVVCYVDNDDDSYDDFEFGRFLHGPRITLSDCWNKCAKNANGEILMMCNDDMVFRTKDWDAMIEDAFADCPDKILMVHGGDGVIRNANFGVFPTIHRRWVDSTGYFVPPVFVGDYPDTWLNDVANALDRRIALPYLTEHLHPVWNKAPIDPVYIEKWDRQGRDNPAELYASLASQRQQDIEKLRKVMMCHAVS